MRGTKERLASRYYNEFITWHGESVICFPCRREIREGDQYRVVMMYDDKGKFEAPLHQDCRDVHDRPRLAIPHQPVPQNGKGVYRRLLMSANEQDVPTAADASAETATSKRKKTRVRKKSASSGKAGSVPRGSKTKKTVKKTTKSKKPRGDGTGSLAVTTGTRLIELGINHPVAKTLAADKAPTNKQLIDLREAVKKRAAELREKKQGAKASSLSSANALVRRMERASR